VQDSARANHGLRLNAAIRYPHERNVDTGRRFGPGSEYCYGAKSEQERFPSHSCLPAYTAPP
jgi:hypothetical protein